MSTENEIKSKLAVAEQDNERYNTALIEMEHKKRWFEQQLEIAQQRLEKVRDLILHGRMDCIQYEDKDSGQWIFDNGYIGDEKPFLSFEQIIDSLPPVRKEEG